MHTDNKYNPITEIGFVLVILGMPLGTAIRNIIPSLELVNILMTASIIFLIDYKNLYNLNFPNFNRQLLIILILNIIFIICAYWKDDTQFIHYHLYCIALIICLSTHSKGLHTKNFFTILIITSIIIIIPCLMQSNINGFQIKSATSNTGDRLFLAEGGDPITTARGVFAVFIGLLLFKSKNIIGKLIQILLIIAAIIVLLSFYTRTVIFATVIVYILYEINKRESHNPYYKKTSPLQNIKRVTTILSILIIILLSYFNIEYISTKIDGIINKMYVGISSIIGHSQTDVSALNRVQLRNKILNDFAFSDDNMSTILFGKGYNHIFADVPAFQIFFDLGIIIGFTYIFYTMYISIRCNITKTENNDFFLYIKLLSVIYCIDQLICGWPYFYMNFVPPIFLLYIIYTHKIGKKHSIT